MIQIAGGILIALAVICLLPVIGFVLWVIYRIGHDMTPEQIARVKAIQAEYELREEKIKPLVRLFQ